MSLLAILSPAGAMFAPSYHSDVAAHQAGMDSEKLYDQIMYAGNAAVKQFMPQYQAKRDLSWKQQVSLAKHAGGVEAANKVLALGMLASVVAYYVGKKGR